MKKTFLILALVIAFNFANPTGQVLNQSPKNNIEFVKVDKSRSLSNNEMLRKKVTLYLRYHVMLARVAMINLYSGYNTS